MRNPGDRRQESGSKKLRCGELGQGGALRACVLGVALLSAAPDQAPEKAPEKLVVVANPHPRQAGSVLSKLKALGRRLYQKPEPQVAAGNALAAQNDAAGALEKYDAAQQRMPDDGALAHDRATALLKLGAEKAPEALSEAARAMDQGDASVKPLAAYDEALALEQLGKPTEAMAGYARALAFDPDDEDSKVNLELLLKGEEQKKQQPQQGQQKPEQKKQQSKKENEQVKGKEEEQQQKDKSEGEKEKERKQEPQPEQNQQPQAEKNQQSQPAEEKPVDRTEAQRLLDALKAGEKNLQVWRFAKQNKKDLKRGDVEKDW